MIFIAVKFTIRPERSAEWLDLVKDFTEATRAEDGNVFYEWSKSVDNPHQFVLLEAFKDSAAGEVHVNSEHFKTAMAWMPDVVASTPEIIHVETPGTGWSAMAEVTPRP
ncbi:putative quinol monooxygenase [Streptomyces abikoensis]|uniref:putative quinol monooxygenase n=1 Tax=Streptomyces abikoensis TaxID=97398 RepID=UPI0016775FA2|nr:putative quinol monooxygenase [Streptomyces abikoensis]GGP45375.1 antibiotic biosynthesis monooxygenase [Streptomyces abikoensis]